MHKKWYFDLGVLDMGSVRAKCVGVIGCGFRAVDLFGHMPHLGECITVGSV